MRIAAVVVVCLAAGQAWAQPPASCARKFVGVWSHAGGTTVVHPDGTATPSAGVSVQRWTCQGDTYLFSNETRAPGDYSATLISPTQMQGSGGIATRVGAPPAAASPPPRGGRDPSNPGQNAHACVSVSNKKSGLQIWYTVKNMCRSPISVSIQSCSKSGACENAVYPLPAGGHVSNYASGPATVTKACNNAGECYAAGNARVP